MHLYGNNEYKKPLIALNKFVNSVKSVLREDLDANLYVLVEYGYSIVDISSRHGVLVLCIPSYDLFRPWKWVLLLHELGHAMFNSRRRVFIEEFRRRILPMLIKLAPRGIEEYVRMSLNSWERYWLKEFVSDLYGIAMGGPAYTYAFMIEVFNSAPS